jgi:hypothetical protein
MPLEVPKGMSTVHADLGSALDVAVPSRGTSGYRWEARPTEGVEVERLPAKPGSSFGGASLDVFRVMPRRLGGITLRLELRAPWETDPAEVRILRIIIN